MKKAHVGVIPGIVEYVNAFTQEDAIGEDGYLADRGLISLPVQEWKKVRDDAKNLTPNL
ncbi:hypothetical protein [Vibrio alfacsensis]|uniref:hypothetical protein n=1 Tax=Vibrio alfacsensis TaxID=1074311 RepID=UPI004069343C